MSSEAKSSAVIIAALPILVGWWALCYQSRIICTRFYALKVKFYFVRCDRLMVLGGLVMRQMINFKVLGEAFDLLCFPKKLTV